MWNQLVDEASVENRTQAERSLADEWRALCQVVLSEFLHFDAHLIRKVGDRARFFCDCIRLWNVLCAIVVWAVSLSLTRKEQAEIWTVKFVTVKFVK